MGAEDPGVYLAGRIRAEHVAALEASEAELRAACRQRGVLVWERPLLAEGYYLEEPAPLIVLRPGVAASVLAHELLHHLAADARAHGIDYGPPYWSGTDPEGAAARFAALLCPGE